jgi:hypothetical protein
MRVVVDDVDGAHEAPEAIGRTIEVTVTEKIQ